MAEEPATLGSSELLSDPRLSVSFDVLNSTPVPTPARTAQSLPCPALLPPSTPRATALTTTTTAASCFSSAQRHRRSIARIMEESTHSDSSGDVAATDASQSLPRHGVGPEEGSAPSPNRISTTAKAPTAEFLLHVAKQINRGFQASLAQVRPSYVALTLPVVWCGLRSVLLVWSATYARVLSPSLGQKRARAASASVRAAEFDNVCVVPSGCG